MSSEEISVEKAIKAAPEKFFEYFDPLFAPLERITGIPAEHFSTAIGPLALGRIIEIPIDATATKLGRKVIKGLIGTLSFLAIVFGGVRGRAGLEGLIFSTYETIRATNLDRKEITELFGNLATLQDGIRTSNRDLILKAFFNIPGSTKSKKSTEEEYKPILPYEPEELPKEPEPIPLLEKEVRPPKKFDKY